MTIKNVCDGCMITTRRPFAERPYSCQASNTNGTSKKIEFIVKVYGKLDCRIGFDNIKVRLTRKKGKHHFPIAYLKKPCYNVKISF